MNKNVFPFIDQLNRMFANTKVKQITLSQVGENLVLAALDKNGSMTPGQICDICHTSSAHTAKTLCQLKVKGYIRRECDLTDKRRATIILTDEGRKKIEEINEYRISYISDILDRLDDEETQQLIHIMDKLNSEVQQ